MKIGKCFLFWFFLLILNSQGDNNFQLETTFGSSEAGGGFGLAIKEAEMGITFLPSVGFDVIYAHPQKYYSIIP